MKKSVSILFILIRLALGSLMVWGGINKFTKPMPAPTAMITIDEAKKAELLQHEEELKLRNYIFGMKQSGFAWELLGVAELLGGILLISQIFSFLGALILVPVTLHIFLFHLKLEPDEKGELIMSFIYFFANLLLIFKEYRLFKPLLKLKVW